MQFGFFLQSRTPKSKHEHQQSRKNNPINDVVLDHMVQIGKRPYIDETEAKGHCDWTSFNVKYRSDELKQPNDREEEQ